MKMLLVKDEASPDFYETINFPIQKWFRGNRTSFIIFNSSKLI